MRIRNEPRQSAGSGERLPVGKRVMPVWAALLLGGLGAAAVPVGTQAQAPQTYLRIVNRWKPDQMIHIQNGAPQAGVAPAGWWSAQWVIR